MPRNITVTFDDGSSHVYNNAPDDVTPEQIEARASRDFAGKRVTALDGGRGRSAAASGTPEGFTGRPYELIPVRPPEGVPAVAAPPAQRAAPVPQEERGLFARIRAGLEAARYTVASIVPGAVGYGVGVLEGIARTAANAPPKDWKPGENLAERRAQQFVDAAVTKPPTALGQEYAQDVGDFARRHGASVAAGPLGLTGSGRHTRAVGDVRTGLRAALGTPGDAPPGLPPVAPSAEKPAGGLAKRVVQPNPALLADVKAAEKAGLTVLPHHVAESDTVRALGTAAGGTVYKQNTKAFTKALIKELDPEEKSVRLDTKTFHRILDKQGKTIGESMAKYDMPVGDDLRARLEAISKDAADNADADTGRMTMNRVREILGKAEAGEGQITGQAARELDTAIGRQIRSNTKNQDLVARLRAVQDVLRDAAERQMAPDEAKAVQQARRRYAYAMEILPDIDDFGRTGYYEPGQLWKRLTSSEAGRQRVANERGGLTDLAKAGALVADRSGTGHGYVSVGSNSVGIGASGMRAYASPSRIAEVAIGVIGGSRAYNRFGPNLVKRLAAEHDAELARAAQAPEPPPLELAAPDAPTPQGPRPDVRGEAPAEVPEWAAEAPGRVARPGDQIPAIEPEGLFTTPDENAPPPRIIHGAGETRRPAPQARAVDPEDPGALPREEAPRKLRGPAEPATVTAGQVAAQRTAQPPLVERTPAEIGEGARRPRVPNIPAVPGRPDMPDVMVVGGPGEVAGNLASGVTGAGRKGPFRETTGTNEAMQSPGAALAREQQGFAPPKPPASGGTPPKAPPPAGGPGGTGAPSGGVDPRLAKIAELRRRSTSPAVTKVLDAQEAELKKTIKRETDIAELEAAAQATDDPGLRQSLLAEANKLRGGKLPVGEVKEGQPDLPKPKTEKIPVGRVIEGQPELPAAKAERIPVGEATEIAPEVVEAAPERLPVGEATEMPEPLPVGEVTENPIPVGEAMEFEPLPVGEATEITPDVVEPARRPVVPRAATAGKPSPAARYTELRSKLNEHGLSDAEYAEMERLDPSKVSPEEASALAARLGVPDSWMQQRRHMPKEGVPDAVIQAQYSWEKSRARLESLLRHTKLGAKRIAEIEDGVVAALGQRRIAADRAGYMKRLADAFDAESAAFEKRRATPGTLENARAARNTRESLRRTGEAMWRDDQQEIDLRKRKLRELERQGRLSADDVIALADDFARGDGGVDDTLDAADRLIDAKDVATERGQMDYGRSAAANEPVVPEATNVDNAPTAPAGGGRSEGMEQTKITHAGMEIQEIPAQGGEPTRWQVTVPETGERVSTPSGLDAAKRIAENERKVIERSGTLAQRMKAADEASAAEERARTEAKKARSAATAGKSLAEIKAMDHMNRTIRVGGEDMKAHEFVDARLAAGDTPKMALVDRVAPMSRRAFNRASNAEQRAHEAKVKAGGKKKTYWLGGYGLSKTEYDYAVKKAAAQQESTRPSPQPATVAPAGGGRIEGVEQTKGEFTQSLAREPASWVIREKATGKVVMETFDRKKVDALNTEKYEAVPALQHLQELNRATKENTRTDPQPATAAPAGGGRSEGMEQTKGVSRQQLLDAQDAEIAKSQRQFDEEKAVIEKELGRLQSKLSNIRNKGEKRDALNERARDARLAHEARVREILAEFRPKIDNHPEELARREASRAAAKQRQQENTRAPQEVTQQAGVPAEPQGRTGGREAAETGAGDRVQRAAESGGQAEGAKESWKRMSATEYRLSDPAGGGDFQIVKKGSNWLNPDTGEKWPTLDGAMRGVRQQIAQEAKTRADEAVSRAEVGPEPAKPAPAPTPVPRTAAPATKPTGKALSPAEVKAEFQRQIDAVPRFDDGGPETITLKAGGSSVKLQNTARRVAEYMKALDTVKGGKTPKPVSEKTGTRPSGVVSWGGEISKRAPITTIKDMIDDLDPQAAVDFAAAQGIDLEEALKGDRKRLDQVRNLKPTPETP